MSNIMSYQKIPDNASDAETPCSIPELQRQHSVSDILNLSIKILTCIFLTLGSILLIMELSSRHNSLLYNYPTTTTINDNNEFKISHTYGTKTRYMSLSSITDKYWTPELSASNALITLSADTASNGTEVHGAISMFHQLHCLSSIRDALQRASNGEDIGTDWNDDLHWPHCLHHLRETILCFADGTVEQGVVVNGSRTTAIDGASDVRMCRDPQVLFEWRKREGVKEFKDADYVLDW